MNAPTTPKADFQHCVSAAIESFPTNAMARKIDAGTFTMADYHQLLLMIFHQTYRTPQSFALAGAMMDDKHIEVRSYLIAHAAEEQDHWKWALNDLEKTGYTGPDPRESLPSPAAAAYIAFNYFIALQQPVARLGIASVLEGLGATYSKEYAGKAARLLTLKPDQMVFFLGHSDTDVVHTEDIRRLLAGSDLTAQDWRWLSLAATTGGRLYRGMYEDAAGHTTT